MATNLNKLVLATMVVAALLRGSWAQTTHVVGDALGWTIPPGGAVAYSNWASKNNFTIGDIMVFNFSSSSHDVAEVTKASFDACNDTSPISISNTGPTNITLTTAGEHYYICTFPSHCTAGQKLAINVTAAATTAPSPPPTTAAPAPSPTSTPPPASVAPTPSSTATPPSATPTPPTTAAPAPSPSATPPPASIAPTPSSTATPPSATPPPPPSPTGTATPSSSPPPPSETTTAPPPPNSATSLAGAALPVALLSIAVALLH